MLAFLSYHHDDRHVAAAISEILDGISISSFMAHEDIEVSHEWHDAILKALFGMDIFIAVLSARYTQSAYCLQESGIAIFQRPKVTAIPLSIDGTVPPGFMNRVQAKKIDPDNVSEKIIFSGIARHDHDYLIRCLTDSLAESRSFATAETRFERLKPFLAGVPTDLAVAILRVSEGNNQIWYARANRPILRGMLETYGKRMPPDLREALTTKLDSIR